MYIDDLIIKLRTAGHGCQITGFYLGCILYADDILLIASSVSELQKMLDICFLEANDLDMRFNIKKCFYFRCGARYQRMCAPVFLGSESIVVTNSIKYLGIVLRNGNKLICNFVAAKLAFYRAFNALYSKCSVAQSELISVHLMKAFCIPRLTYAVEATNLSKCVFKMFDNCIDNAMRKVFNVSDGGVVANLRCALGILNMDLVYHRAVCKYMLKFCYKSLSFACLLVDLVESTSESICRTYAVKASGRVVTRFRMALNAIETHIAELSVLC